MTNGSGEDPKEGSRSPSGDGARTHVSLQENQIPYVAQTISQSKSNYPNVHTSQVKCEPIKELTHVNLHGQTM